MFEIHPFAKPTFRHGRAPVYHTAQYCAQDEADLGGGLQIDLDPGSVYLSPAE